VCGIVRSSLDRDRANHASIIGIQYHHATIGAPDKKPSILLIHGHGSWADTGRDWPGLTHLIVRESICKTTFF
jgi:hypothetical protein